MIGAVYIPKINPTLMWESLPFILQGLPYTVGISVVTFLLGNIFGLFLTMLMFSDSKVIQLFVKGYTSFMRGVPGLVLLFILYFGLPYQLTALQAVIICFTMTSSAFLSEIYRGAISGVDSGQWDAAKALGLPYTKTMYQIIIPQAFRIAIPSLGNVAMDLVKGTSLAAMITVPEIFQKAKIIGGREFDYMSIYILVAILYWLMCWVVGKIQYYMERRYAVYQ
ncbi:amino acid ABC transporter permease [Vagococcus lutrae]|uniref:amino acid ABC transporter permease n=1 Tax=Vagococcus lutrae TaxID=81947 RepID=UPI00288C82C8|nr:amino acid ABC transporter permease [Vagococcus lutrae]MDT2823788.1 amino acid ABC transporter permease [Vagococcus lutrae]